MFFEACLSGHRITKRIAAEGSTIKGPCVRSYVHQLCNTLARRAELSCLKNL